MRPCSRGGGRSRPGGGHWAEACASPSETRSPRLAIKERFTDDEQTALLDGINQLVAKVPFDPETGEFLERHDESAEADDQAFWPPPAR
jgi:hypothetical protein